MQEVGKIGDVDVIRDASGFIDIQTTNVMWSCVSQPTSLIRSDYPRWMLKPGLNRNQDVSALKYLTDFTFTPF